MATWTDTQAIGDPTETEVGECTGWGLAWGGGSLASDHAWYPPVLMPLSNYLGKLAGPLRHKRASWPG